MFKNVDILWGAAVPFDVEKRGLYMVYYGIFIKGIFFGVSHLIEKDQMRFKPKTLKPA